MTDADKTTISGDFFIINKDGKTGIRAEDVTIDGLSFPKFSWQWIAMGLAQGVLGAIGSLIFSLFLNAIFKGTKQQKSIEQLLQEQLDDFRQILHDAINANEIRRYGAETTAYFRLYNEYAQTQDRDSLRLIKDNSAVALANLESLGFTGYRTYMSAVSLRLLVLQESYRRNMATQKLQLTQADQSIEHHRSIIAHIDRMTEPSTYTPRGTPFSGGYWSEELPQHGGRGRWYFNSVAFKGRILGIQIDDGLIPMHEDHTPYSVDEVSMTKRLILKNSDHRYVADRVVDFEGLRRAARAGNTDYGEKMVQRWTNAVQHILRN